MTLFIASFLVSISFSSADKAPGNQAESKFNLERYERVLGPVKLLGEMTGASGITFNYDTESLFVVASAPAMVFELSKSGEVLRTIHLAGFQDTEGITYLGNSRFSVLEERRRKLLFFEIKKDTQKIKRHKVVEFTLPRTGEGNSGPEGMAFNPEDNSIYILNESEPRKIWKVGGFLDAEQNISVSELWDLEENGFENIDYAGLHFDPIHQRLLLLSQESQELVESDLGGNLFGRLKLSNTAMLFGQGIKYAEGVAMDNNAAIYVVAEPNLFYRFQKKQKSSQ